MATGNPVDDRTGRREGRPVNVTVPLVHGLPSHAGLGSTAVRPLTGMDEIGLAQEIPGWEDRLLAAVCAFPDGADPAGLSVGDRNALLLGALAATFGARLSWLVDCASCGAPLDVDLDIDELLTAQPGQPAAGLPAFRVPTIGDLAAVRGLDPEAARAALLERCVEGALDAATEPEIEEAMAAADPLSDITLALTCSACEARWSAAVDVAGELLARLTAPADLLVDVHALALAYGWTEPAVLALPRPRRQEYLGLVADLAAP
jgi:hypothetical protein